MLDQVWVGSTFILDCSTEYYIVSSYLHLFVLHVLKEEKDEAKGYDAVKDILKQLREIILFYDINFLYFLLLAGQS